MTTSYAAHPPRTVSGWDRVAIVLLAAAGFAQSFDALRQMAQAAHVRGELTWLFPLLVDGSIAYGIRALLVLNRARWRARAYAWLMFAVATATSIWANALHAVRLNGPADGATPGSGLHLGDTAVAVLATVAPIACAGAVHLYIVITRETTRTAPAATASTTMPVSISSTPASTSPGTTAATSRPPVPAVEGSRPTMRAIGSVPATGLHAGTWNSARHPFHTADTAKPHPLPGAALAPVPPVRVPQYAAPRTRTAQDTTVQTAARRPPATAGVPDTTASAHRTPSAQDTSRDTKRDTSQDTDEGADTGPGGHDSAAGHGTETEDPAQDTSEDTTAAPVAEDTDPETDEAMLRIARATPVNSRSQYSRDKVGAAIRAQGYPLSTDKLAELMKHLNGS